MIFYQLCWTRCFPLPPVAWAASAACRTCLLPWWWWCHRWLTCPWWTHPCWGWWGREVVQWNQETITAWSLTSQKRFNNTLICLFFLLLSNCIVLCNSVTWLVWLLQDTEYMYQVDLPGCSPESVDVKCMDNNLTVCAERRSCFERTIHSERKFGKTSRTIRIPADADQSRANSTFENGVLTVTFPKLASSAVQKRSVMKWMNLPCCCCCLLLLLTWRDVTSPLLSFVLVLLLQIHPDDCQRMRAGHAHGHFWLWLVVFSTQGVLGGVGQKRTISQKVEEVVKQWQLVSMIFGWIA